jgi:hypothetical protein
MDSRLNLELIPDKFLSMNLLVACLLILTEVKSNIWSLFMAP